MDRKLTLREKIKARSKPIIIPGIFVLCFLAVPVVVSNHAEIFAGIDKVRAAITEIANYASFLFETILT